MQVGEVEQMVKGANGISWARPTPLGDCLLGVYFRIFGNILNKSFLFKSWKIFKIFITLLCYGLHKNFVKNMSLGEITVKGAKGAKVKVLFQRLHMTCVIPVFI
jgi:hypothetical protein